MYLATGINNENLSVVVRLSVILLKEYASSIVFGLGSDLSLDDDVIMGTPLESLANLSRLETRTKESYISASL
jgi:hypothetical protein